MCVSACVRAARLRGVGGGRRRRWRRRRGEIGVDAEVDLVERLPLESRSQLHEQSWEPFRKPVPTTRGSGEERGYSTNTRIVLASAIPLNHVDRVWLRMY